jgi:hypothetical protein
MEPIILYDIVLNENGDTIFGEVPGECYMWCFRKENRDRAWTVIVGRTGEELTIQDYLFKVT